MRLFCFFIFPFALGLAWALSGCAPDQNSSDEEKEPHFVLGQSRVNDMDYQSAVEAFEESLEVNPHSAQAHYQLAMLYDAKISDPAAAIYHYEQYLKFDPGAPNAGIVRQRIDACKQQLAAAVLALPASSATQQQLEKLIEQNRQLQDELDKWRAYYAAEQAAKTNPMPQNNFTAQPAQNPIPVQPQNDSTTPAQNLSPNHAANRLTRQPSPEHSHMVVAGETAAAICRKHGIKLNALQTANPGVNLNRLRVGQILKIP